MNEHDVQKEQEGAELDPTPSRAGANNEHEVIPDTRSRHSPDAPIVHLQGEVSMANLLTLLDVSPDALVIVNQAGRIEHVNNQAEALFGYQRSELEGLQLEILLPERFRAAHVLHRERYAASPRTRPMGVGLELYGRRKDGTEVPVDISLSPLQLTGTLHVLGAIRDITDRRRLEERERAARQEAEQLKDEFISIAAHELRTPLAILKGFAQTLLVQTARGKGPELANWQAEALHGIDQATSRLVELTEDLLDVTRLQARRLTLQLEATDLIALVQRVVTRLQMTTEHHAISINTPLEHLVVQVDPRRMEQVLSNLIGNAIKYSPAGGMIEVTVREKAETKLALLDVSDHGIGIPAQQQSLVFGRFARADNARAYGIGGTGLGLYLCRELVERHGGRIWFESVEGRGSTFFVTLPIVPDADPT